MSTAPEVQSNAANTSLPAAEVVLPNPEVQADSVERNLLRRRLEDVLREHYQNPDVDGARITLAAVAAHRIAKHSPTWLLNVAPSGSMKTEIMKALAGLPSVHYVDEMTENTFISGKVDSGKKKRTTPASYLHRIGSEGILVVPDFSTLLEMDERRRGQILAQLRRIYDGQLNREFGTDENLDEREWKGHLTLLGSATPDIDRHHGVFQALGERFLRNRLPRAGGIDAGLSAIQQESSLAEEVKAAVHAYIRPILEMAEIEPPSIPADIAVKTANLGELVALGRTFVPRDRFTRQIDGDVAPEGNTRLPQQLAQLGRGLAVLDGRSELNEDDFRLIRRVAFDSMPLTRRLVLEALWKGYSPHSVGQPSATVSRAVEDLIAVGLVKKNPETAPISHSLTELAEDLLSAIDAKTPTMVN